MCKLKIKANVFSLLLFAGAVVMMAVGFASCSSDDDELKEVKVDFKLLNEKGEVTTTFAEGENITFDISVINRSDECVFLESNAVDAFRALQLIIFDEEDFFAGCPWDGYSSEDALSPNQSLHWRTCYMINEVENPTLPPFDVTETRPPLPKGK